MTPNDYYLRHKNYKDLPTIVREMIALKLTGTSTSLEYHIKLISLVKLTGACIDYCIYVKKDRLPAIEDQIIGFASVRDICRYYKGVMYGLPWPYFDKVFRRHLTQMVEISRVYRWYRRSVESYKHKIREPERRIDI